MTYPEAKLAFLTDPEPGKVFLLNVQVEGGELMRFRINRDQLLLINQVAADFLVKAFQ